MRISDWSSDVCSYDLPKDGLRTDQDKETAFKSLSEVKRRFPDGVPILDPLENMDITDESFKKLLRKIEVLESRLLANPLHLSPLLPSLWDQTGIASCRERVCKYY